MSLKAVITGDIVNSTKLAIATERKLVRKLTNVLGAYKFGFYRGDSFQVFVKNPASALRVALLARAVAINTPTQEKKAHCDIRISIGIGTAQRSIRSLASAKGEAFVASGRGFDDLVKTGSKLAIAAAGSHPPSLSYGLELVSSYTDAIFRGMTMKKAEVVASLLAGKTQQEIAKELKKSKSTISQLTRSARWAELEWLLNMYEKLIAEIK